MKYIMCAKTFPVYHPKAGRPTNFRQSILNGTKLHTIRNSTAGKRTGETVSLREWAGKPYRSKQIEFAQCKVRIGPIHIRGSASQDQSIKNLAQADGFADPLDFQHWFTNGKDEPLNFDGVCIGFVDVIGTETTAKEESR